MEWLREKSILILCTFINVLFILNLMKSSLLISNFSYLIISLLYFISVFIYWIYSYVLKNKKQRFLVMGILIAIFAIICYKNFDLVTNFIQKEFIKNTINLYNLADKHKPTEFSQYKYFFILSFFIVIPVLLTVFSKFAYSILVVSFCYINLMWFLGYTKEVKESLNIYLFITLFSLSMIIYCKRTLELTKNNIDVRINKVKIIAYTCIFSFIISTTSICLPQKFVGKASSNYKGRFINKFSKYGAKGSLDMAKDSSYNLKSSGYSNNNKKLGGRINLNNKVAFSVLGNGVRYLKGSVKDYYTGDMWRKSNYINYIKGNKGQDIPVRYKLRNYDEKKAQITIKPENIRTTSLLTPAYAYKVSGVKGDLYYERTPTFLSTDIQDMNYTISFYINSFETLEELKKRFLRRNKVYTEYFIGNMIYSNKEEKQFFAWNEEEILNSSNSFDIMDGDTVRSNYNNYLQVPNTVPKRVYDLVYDITSGCSNNAQKMEKIINYLDKNYNYSLEVFDVPKGKDFVDYFLFEEKKGYCTYFGTAMTIMCRIAGMPSRYVEGFKTNKKVETSGFTKITNEEAHAWCEVLVDPYADLWVVADPSPTPVEYRMKKNKKKKTEINYGNIKRKNNSIQMENINDDYGKSNVKNKSLDKNKLNILIVPCVTLLIIIINIGIYIIRKRKIISSKSIVPLYNNTLKRLRSVNVYIKNSMGDLEFANSIEDEELRSGILNIVEVYYKENYGNIIDDSFNKQNFYNYIENYIIRRQGKIKYYFVLFISNYGIKI